MRFQVLDGGAAGGPSPPRRRPPRRDTPFGLIDLPWLAARAESERALIDAGPDADLRSLQALYDRGQVCAQLCSTLALRTEPGAKAEALLHEALREAAMEMLAGFLSASLGTLGRLDHAQPYLRVIATLGSYASLQGQTAQAVEYWQLLFHLDRDDTMVVRGAYMGALLQMGMTDEALELWHDWRGDDLPSLVWSLPLAYWLAGDLERAESALALARQTCATPETYLCDLNPDFEPGSLEMMVWVDLAQAWAANQDAGRWMAAQPRREATDADYATLGLVKPPPGVDPTLAQQLDADDLKRLTSVCKGIIKFATGRMPQDQVDMALMFANEMAEVSDCFFGGAVKSWVAGIIWLVSDAHGGKLALPSLAAELKVSARTICQRATEVAFELRSQSDDEFDEVDWDNDPFGVRDD